MGSRDEARGFELDADLLEIGAGGVRHERGRGGERAIHAVHAEADRFEMKRLHRPVQVFSQLYQMRDLGARRLLLEQRQQGVDLVECRLAMRLTFGWIRGDHPLDPFWPPPTLS